MIKVIVYKRASRKFYEAEWTDPQSGKRIVRTTKAKTSRDAERFAERLEKQLSDGGGELNLLIEWPEFLRRYATEVLVGQREKSRKKMLAVMSVVGRYMSPKRLTGITASRISSYAAKLRANGRTEATVKSHLVCLRAALSWAKRVGMIREIPGMTMPPNAATMKGRPISFEEFKHMLARLPEVVGIKRAPKFAGDLIGCWYSGLRLQEALDLDWNDYRKISVDLTGEYPMFRIQVASDKGKEFRVLPMAPDFAKWLLKTPEAKRHGKVFRFPPAEGKAPRVGATRLSRIIQRLGCLADIEVASRTIQRDGKSVDKKKFASFHDFRRSFGFRWAGIVMPKYLMEMMRHSAISTTMEFYVGRNSADTARVLWERFADTSADTKPAA